MLDVSAYRNHGYLKKKATKTKEEVKLSLRTDDMIRQKVENPKTTPVNDFKINSLITRKDKTRLI